MLIFYPTNINLTHAILCLNTHLLYNEWCVMCELPLLLLQLLQYSMLQSSFHRSIVHQRFWIQAKENNHTHSKLCLLLRICSLDLGSSSGNLLWSIHNTRRFLPKFYLLNFIATYPLFGHRFLIFYDFFHRNSSSYRGEFLLTNIFRFELPGLAARLHTSKSFKNFFSQKMGFWDR